MPYFKRDDKQRKLMQGLKREFKACAQRYGLTLGNFPDVHEFRAKMEDRKGDCSTFVQLDKRMIADIDKMLTDDIAKLMERAQISPPSGKSSSGGRLQ
jgi:Domain of unknown function (DUF5600)